ncbi:MAG: ribonuclease Z [Christensenellaceae bacterium]|nr:ribonuclease Z [Christensenellaceae bacterium]
MTLFVCVDDRMGMAFFGRRQSRDSAVCKDIAATAGGQTIGMAHASAKLFDGIDARLAPGADPKTCGFYFLEFAPPSTLIGPGDTLVLYRWNRHYAADLHFDIPLEGKLPADVREFAGTSHETITREVYKL